ncbi:MAG: tyrosine-type recombinase/integrase [Saprospiraceae bacterium]|nr:tyrosine-type recombinase/integrase [Saprospiraceae bacterium]
MMDFSESTYESVYGAYRDYLLVKNYSRHTLNTYLCNFRLYHKWCICNQVADIYLQERVKDYLVYRIENGAKWQTMNNIYSAMRKLFREVLELEWSFKKLPRPNKERHLPELISQQEVFRLIQSCRLLKHRAVLVTLYASGLRSAELCSLRLDDIDSDRMQFRIRRGKGAKDRYVQIPKELIDYLLSISKNVDHNFIYLTAVERDRACQLAHCVGLSEKRRSVWDSQKRSHLTPCDTAMRPITWNLAQIWFSYSKILGISI